MEGEPDLRSTRCVIVDEAHERTSAVDVVLGILKILITRRKDLKVIIMSATLNADKFRNYFGGPEKDPLLAIPGRTHPVEIMYTKDAVNNILNGAVRIVAGIHREKPAGDVLVVLPGKEELDLFRRGLEQEIPQGLEVLALHSQMDFDEQNRALSRPAGSTTRRCVAAPTLPRPPSPLMGSSMWSTLASKRLCSTILAFGCSDSRWFLSPR